MDMLCEPFDKSGQSYFSTHAHLALMHILWVRAVRVNETDAFGEDEDRDEYFDFEDVSEI